MRKRSEKLILGIIGLIFVGVGAGMLVKTGYGADTLNACFTGIVKKTGLSLGTITTIFNAIMIILIYFIKPKLVGIGMILSVFILKFPIDFVIAVYPAGSNIWLGLCSDILSLIIFSFGAALMIESEMGCTVYDGLTLIATDKAHLPFRIVRLFCDGICFVLGFIFGGEIGIGTILSFLLMAPCIDGFRKIIQKKIAIHAC